MAGYHVGTYFRDSLVIHGMMGDLDPIHIGARGAVVHGQLSGDIQFEFNDRCSRRDAALAVTSLVVLIAGDQQRPH
jgi:hypothetical protein